MSDWTVTFPEPTTFNGDDNRPMPSGGRDGGPAYRDLKRAIYAAVRLYGADRVRECLAEVERETK